MLLPLLALAACFQPTRGAGPGTGEVEVRLLGVEDQLRPSPCGQTGAIIWVDDPFAWSRPGHELIAWRACGPEPALSVLPPGSTVVLRNDSGGPLDLRWEQPDGGPEQASLAAGGERRVVLGDHGTLQIEGALARAFVVSSAAGVLTDGAGRATLEAVHAGTMDLHVLHPSLGGRAATVTVPEDERVVVELELPRQL